MKKSVVSKKQPSGSPESCFFSFSFYSKATFIASFTPMKEVHGGCIEYKVAFHGANKMPAPVPNNTAQFFQCALAVGQEIGRPVSPIDGAKLLEDQIDVVGLLFLVCAGA